MNTLYYGDNLKVLREHIKDESIDLIYLDPPFNSNRSYNVLFKDESGLSSESQITAFDDAWHWGDSAQQTYHELLTSAPGNVASMIDSLFKFIGANQMMAYLVMMAARLVELHRVLKPTGSLYLHCDPTASHYLKILLDMIFGPMNFINEIVWKRTTAHNTTSRKLGDITDTILFYSKNSSYNFSPPRSGHSEDYVNSFYKHIDENGRRYRLHLIERNRGIGIRANLIYEYKGYTPQYGWMMEKVKLEEFDRLGKLYWSSNGRPSRKIFLDEVKAPVVGNLWDDIPPIQAQAAERLGYPTQKPLALLERIIQASSNPGDVVLDPFSGCGTCIAASQKLGRQWIGIDVTHLAIAMHKSRLKGMFGLEPKKDYEIIGEPEDIQGARQLAAEDRYQFQWWALSLIEAKPLGSGEGKTGKKGSDRGIDGVVNFLDDHKGGLKRALVQVKSGHVKSGDIRDLKGTLEREGAQIGVFITLESATRDMLTEAVTAGVYHSEVWNRDYPRIQIITVEELLDGVEVKIPPSISKAFKQASKEEGNKPKQGSFDL